MASTTASAAPSSSTSSFGLFLDDTLPSFTYFPFADTFSSPNTSAGWNPYFSTSAFAASQGDTGTGTSYHVTALEGAAVEVSWSGTSITLFGSTFPPCTGSSNESCTSFTTTIDGVQVTSNSTIPTSITPSISKTLASFTNLQNGRHTMRLVVHPSKPPELSSTTDPAMFGVGAGSFFAFDGAVIEASPPGSDPSSFQPKPPRAIPDDEVSFLGQWSVLNVTDASPSTGTFGNVTGLTTSADGQILMHRSNRVGDKARVIFRGTTLVITGMSSPSSAAYNVSVQTVPTGSENAKVKPSTVSNPLPTSSKPSIRKRRKARQSTDIYNLPRKTYVFPRANDDGDNFNMALSAKSSFKSPATQLFVASGLDPALTHQVTITNIDGGELSIRADGFVTIDALPPSPAPTTSVIPVSTGAAKSFPQGTIAALVLAGILSALLLIGLLIYFRIWRPKRKRQEAMRQHSRGLSGVRPEDDDTDSVVFRYGTGHSGMGGPRREKYDSRVLDISRSEGYHDRTLSESFDMDSQDGFSNTDRNTPASFSFSHAGRAMGGQPDIETFRGSGSTGFRRWRQDVTGRGRGLLGLGLIFSNSSGSGNSRSGNSRPTTSSNSRKGQEEDSDESSKYEYGQEDVVYSNVKGKQRKHDSHVSSKKSGSGSRSSTQPSFTISLPTLSTFSLKRAAPAVRSQLQIVSPVGIITPEIDRPSPTRRGSQGRLLDDEPDSGSSYDEGDSERRRRVSLGMESGDDALRGLSPRTSEVTPSPVPVVRLPKHSQLSSFTVDFQSPDADSPVIPMQTWSSQPPPRRTSDSGLTHVRFEGSPATTPPKKTPSPVAGPSTSANLPVAPELHGRTSFLDFGGHTPEGSVRTGLGAVSSAESSDQSARAEESKSEKSRWSTGTSAAQQSPSLAPGDVSRWSNTTGPSVAHVPSRQGSGSTGSSSGSGAQFVTVPSTDPVVPVPNAFPVSLPPSPHHPHTVRISSSVPLLSAPRRISRIHPAFARLSLDTTSPTDSIPLSVSDIHFAHSESESHSSSNSEPRVTSLPAHPPLPSSAGMQQSFLLDRVMGGGNARSPLTPVTRFEHSVQPPTPSVRSSPEER